MPKPGKLVAEEALRELHRIFTASAVTKKELITTARRIRRELVKKLYGGAVS